MANYSIEFYSKSFARIIKVELVIPSLNLHGCLGNKDINYYQNCNKKYPLAIFLHGFGENERSWIQNSTITQLLEANGIAGCFINGENKWYLDQGPIQEYYSFIEVELLDFLYGNFNALSKELPLIIAGESMGGYGSLYHYLKNVDKYSACIALSPATRPDFLDESKYGSLKDLFLANKDNKLNIYLSIGSKDFIYNASMELNNFLIENNIDASYKVIDNKDHSWKTWNDELPNVVNYLRNKEIIK